MFTSKMNTLTGKMDWEIQSEDYDYQQELARAGFADMLHDLDRNIKYFAGLKKVIRKLKSENKHVHVLDIGTGTGLLSMMAVHCGADRVTACEAFKPMIQVAKDCIASNGMAGKIQIIEKRSTEITVGKGMDIDEKANVLVTEVFDTELIGEGAISTFTHALDNLLTKDCYVIPDNAVMYVQIVDSKFCRDWNWLNLDKKYGLNVPFDYRQPAGDSICDMQLDQFEGKFTPITEPLVAFEFSFSGRERLVFENKNLVKAESARDGECHAVFMWWVCRMDWENEILMSCAPKWANHALAEEIPWRDHWMQAIYFPKNYFSLKKGDELYVSCNHDEYSLWFDVLRPLELSSSGNLVEERSLGNTIVSRNRLGQLNDTDRTDMFLRLFKKYEDCERSVLIANDDLSLLGVLVAKSMNFKNVFVLETNRLRKNCLKKIVEENELKSTLTIVEKFLNEVELSDLNNYKIDLVMSELAFSASHLPWENLCFYYGVKSLYGKKILSDLCPIDIDRSLLNILPFRVRFYAIAVQFDHLHKIRCPVVETCGFTLKEFDRVILDASKKSDGFMEPHPVWEYPCRPLSQVHEIFFYDEQSQNLENNFETKVDMPLVFGAGELNGVVIWQKVDYDETDVCMSLNTGLVGEVIKGEPLVWSENYKQAVHIMDKMIGCEGSENVECRVSFNAGLGKFDVRFKVVLKNGLSKTSSGPLDENLGKHVLV